MKKVIYGFLIMSLIWLVFYLFGAFMAASLDVSAWGGEFRVWRGLIAMIIGAARGVAYIERENQ